MIGLVRYTVICLICAAVEVRYGYGESHRRLLGWCMESPQETFSPLTGVLARGDLKADIGNMNDPERVIT